MWAAELAHQNRRPTRTMTEKTKRKEALIQMGTLSPYPWDLPLYRQNGWFAWGGWRRPAIPAPESALGSHPCVALSSAQVLTV